MDALADALSTLIADHAESVLASDERQCRLIFPGITVRLACSLHHRLRSLLRSRGVSVPVFLALDNPSPEHKPNEAQGWLEYEALTSVRHGSFIAICMPKVLPKLQDSVRGTGSPIRSATLHDEWPWVDDGMAEFAFDGPVLDAVVDRWVLEDEEARKWIRGLVSGNGRTRERKPSKNGLLDATRHLRDSDRTGLLIDEMLGAFDPSDYPELASVTDKFCFHCGLPARGTGSVGPAP